MTPMESAQRLISSEGDPIAIQALSVIADVPSAIAAPLALADARSDGDSVVGDAGDVGVGDGPEPGGEAVGGAADVGAAVDGGAAPVASSNSSWSSSSSSSSPLSDAVVGALVTTPCLMNSMAKRSVWILRTESTSATECGAVIPSTVFGAA